MTRQIVSQAIRGAITVESNTEEEISRSTVELLQTILEENSITSNDIAHAIFTMTHDLNAAFPAKTARTELGWSDVPMICTQEVPVPKSLSMCIRVLVVINTEKSKQEIRHVYLKSAKYLRKDLLQ